MKFFIVLSVLSIVAVAIGEGEIDWASQDNPGGESRAPAETTAEVASETASNPALKPLLEEGKTLYKKYIDGKFVDKKGIPDMNKAPAALKKSTSEWADKVEKAGFDVEDVITEVENSF